MLEMSNEEEITIPKS